MNDIKMEKLEGDLFCYLLDQWQQYYNRENPCLDYRHWEHVDEWENGNPMESPFHISHKQIIEFHYRWANLGLYAYSKILDGYFTDKGMNLYCKLKLQRISLEDFKKGSIK